MIEGWANAPAHFTIEFPRASSGGIEVGYNFCSQWHKWCGVKIELTMDVDMSW